MTTAPPTRWQLKPPKSKADSNAIHTFQRAVKVRNKLLQDLRAADMAINAAVEELKRRDQIEIAAEQLPASTATPQGGKDGTA